MRPGADRPRTTADNRSAEPAGVSGSSPSPEPHWAKSGGWATPHQPPGLHRLYRRPAVIARAISRHFNRLYYYRFERTLAKTTWMGVPVLKTPADLWVYQEIIWEIRPKLVVEAGTYKGGSALFLASLLDLLGNGEVLTIDIASMPDRPQHDRVSYLEGSSVAPEVVERVRSVARDPVLVILDSDHGRDHILAELHAYGNLVTPGSYLIVEDTNLNGNPVLPGWGPGPAEAVAEFLAERDDYVADSSREKFMLTQNPNGYLRRRS